MRVLIGCEFSGVIRRAFRALGHEAWSCDLLESLDNSEYHVKGDVRELLNQHWDLGIFHPPCQYLSISGMHWTDRGLRDPKLTEDALDFVKELMSANIEKIAIENPVSVISTRIRKQDQTIQPYEYGEDASKKTFLWLKNLPKLEPTNYVQPRLVNGVQRWGNQLDSGNSKLGQKKDRAKLRSISYEGIAKAMAAQWGGNTTKQG